LWRIPCWRRTTRQRRRKQRSKAAPPAITPYRRSQDWSRRRCSATDASGRTPASQALRYLRLAEELSHGQVRWALLTNGRLWRLYFQGAGSKAEQFLEADLPALLEADTAEALATFILLFRRDSFVPGQDGRSFFQAALDLARAWREQVTADLAGAVFDDVFPALLDALARVLDRLSVIRKLGEEPRWINYRDLSVQQFGAIYEGLLERRVEVRAGRVAPVHDNTLRHDIGAYYHPRNLCDW
jgi:hypothetical protein